MTYMYSYIEHIRNVVSNNPSAVAQKMLATKEWTKDTVTPLEFVQFIGQSRTTDPEKLATLVATLLNVPISPLGDWRVELENVRNNYPQWTAYDISYQLAYSHFKQKKESLDPSVLEAFERDADRKDKEHLPEWLKIGVGVFIALAVIGGVIAFFKMFSSKD